MKFKQFNLDDRLIEALDEAGIDTPTEIQLKSIPAILQKKNVLGLAPTGTGKTYAYLVPVLHHLFNAKIEHDDPYIVILVPTRELAKQIFRFLKIFRKNTEITVQIASTGVNEIKEKTDFTDILIATPGNLLKQVQDGEIELANSSILIIDEIDRMVDLHFYDDTTHLLEYMPHKNQRQTLLFGSTLPQKVEPLVTQIQKNSFLVDVGRSTAPPTISHEIYEITRDEKYDLLKEILQTEPIESVIIFTRSQNSSRITTKNLLRDGLDVEEIHGGLTQRQRTQALTNFATGQVAVMVATDIAARGIDISELSHVISFDVPRKFNDYLHRAGRTGRMDTKGKSIILAAPDEFEHLEGIKKRLNPKKVHIKRQIQIEKPRSLSNNSKTNSNTRYRSKNTSSRRTSQFRGSKRYGDKRNNSFNKRRRR